MEQAEIAFHSIYEQCQEWAEQSLALYRTLDNPCRMAYALDLLGNTLRSSGLFERSKSALEEGLAIRQAMGDARGVAESLQNLGGVIRLEGRFEASEEAIRQSIAILRELEDRGLEAHGVTSLASTYVQGGKYAEGLRIFEEAQEIRLDQGLPDDPVISTVTSYALMLSGQYQQARTCARQALAITTQTDSTVGGFPLMNLGRVAQAEESYVEAQRYLLEGLPIFRARGEMTGFGETLACLGYVALRLHDL